MRYGLKILMLLGFVSLSFKSSVFAEGGETWVHCPRTSEVGLFEQCQEVRIMNRVGERVRAYSFSKKRLLNVPDTEIYQLLEIENRSQDWKSQKVVIPGELLWGQTSKKTQTLCAPVQDLGQEIQVDCGSSESVVRVSPDIVQYLGNTYRAQNPPSDSTQPTLRSEAGKQKQI